MDGCDPLPDADIGTCRYGDEFACARLQHETGNEYPGDGFSEGGDEGVDGGDLALFMAAYRPA